MIMICSVYTYLYRHIDFRCDVIRHCIDESDEESCLQSTTGFQCLNNDLILKKYKNDLIPDCSDASDEVEYENQLRYPRPMVLCPRDQLPCFHGKPFCYPISLTCLYDLDMNGELLACRNGAHLTNCNNWLCQRSYKCDFSYCIPLRYICDGTVDCPNGEDEIDCKDPLPCPGLLKCRLGQCVHPSEVCDGIVHCPLADDERTCLGECPNGCVCYGRSISCHYSPNQKTLPEFTYQMSYLGLRGEYATSLTEFCKSPNIFNLLVVAQASEILLSQITSNRQFIVEFRSLVRLDISVNLITRLDMKSFINMFHLADLDVSRNRIGTIKEESFKHIGKLLHLNISNQNITSPLVIRDTAFAGLHQLNVFDIRNNGIVSLKKVWFDSMSALRVVYLDGNPLYDVDPLMIGMFSSEIIFHSDQPKMCCLSFTSCSKMTKRSRLCSRLLQQSWLNPMYFILGGLVSVSNGFVIILRWNTRIDSLHKLTLFSMAVADLGYGVYMLTLATVDSYYGSTYPFSDHHWQAHPLCKTIGFISTLFIEMSVMCSLIVARDRYKVICSGNLVSQQLWSKRKALLSFIIIWLCCFSAIALLFHNNFIVQQLESPICTFLTTSDENVLPRMLSFLTFGVFNMIQVIILTIAYLLLMSYLRKANKFLKGVTHSKRKTSNEITLRTVGIICISFSVWTAIIILTGVALYDYNSLYYADVWIGAFLLPIQPLLNPFIFTLTTSKYRQKQN